MAHELPQLPYAYDAFTNVIDEQTMRLHHDIHHNGYVTGLNNAEQKLQDARDSGDFGLIKLWQKEAAFHGSGHALHTIFWNNLSPDGGGTPSGDIGSGINKDFGSFDKFKAHFLASTNGVEGSGWGILAYQKAWDKLVILQVEKHHDVTVFGSVPLLVVDVWEHAYYLKYQNKRPEYTKNIFDIFNWNDVEQRLSDARG
ncbi:superoxide dismutase [candidate division KSB1 bacterium]|nr:superoxide dismutase [candidate division KSB1 bacterium]